MKITAHVSNKNRVKRLNLHSFSLLTTGFTLIELLVSITVLMVLAGVGLPQLNGVYENQKLTNAANELVTELKSLQNKALANNQDKFTVPEASGGPLNDCMPSPDNKPYVDGYRLSIQDRSYETSFKLRTHNKAGAACPNTPLVNDRIATVLLPPGVKFGGGEAGKSVVYNVVSGKITLSGNPSLQSEELTLSNERLPSTARRYHICINQGRVYAKTSACP